MLRLRIDIVFLYPSRRGLLLLPAFFLPTQERSFVKKVLKPRRGEIFVDIGAYIGRCSLLVAKHLREDGKVVSIEAHPYNYKILVRNIKLNSLKNIVPINLAISSQSGLARLYIGRWHTQHSLLPRSKCVHQNNFIEVPCRTLDEILEILGIKRVDLIRVDVEGGELQVLRGCEKTLQNNPQLRLLVQSYLNPKDILSYLKKKGFKIYVVGFKRRRLPIHIYAVRY